MFDGCNDDGGDDSGADRGGGGGRGGDDDDGVDGVGSDVDTWPCSQVAAAPWPRVPRWPRLPHLGRPSPVLLTAMWNGWPGGDVG